MDKHDRRYLFDYFGHCTENLSFYDALNYINQTNDEDAFSYLSSAVKDEFDGDQLQFLQFKIWSKLYD
jgi:hypothetical protein